METQTIKQVDGFNPELLNVSNKEIVNEIRANGFYAFEGALDIEYVDQLLSEVDFNNILLNKNDVGVVATQNNKYLTHCLASSQKAYDIITSSKILAICNEYFTDNFKLINHRVYQTSKKQHLPWHTDNNRLEGSRMSEKHDMPGLCFMFYLSEVPKNPFQLVRGSHLWSHKYNSESFFTDSFIDKNHSENIVTFRLKKGSFIICDIHGIHRAEPFNDDSYNRTTLLFQVDQVGNGNAGHGEKNIINTEYLKNLTPELCDYLGFGFKRDYMAFPDTSITTMTTHDILKLQKQLFKKSFGAIAQNVVRNMMSPTMMTSLKRLRFRKAKRTGIASKN
jgi:hypothetical protein